MTIDELIVVQK